MARRRAPAQAPSVAVLGAALTWTHGALQHARAADPATPTPCLGWDLQSLLEHLDDSLSALREAASGRVEVVDAGPSAPTLVDQVCRRARSVAAAWQARVTSAPVAVGDLSLGRDTLTLVGAVEVVVHGWDVARTVGCDWEVPADLATRLLPVALACVDDGERTGRFAGAVPLGPGADAASRLLAHLGRDPRWRPDGVRLPA